VLVLAAVSFGLPGCKLKEAGELPTAEALPPNSRGDATAKGGSPSSEAVIGQPTSGKIEIDGSSTVFPISQGVVEEFMRANPKVVVGLSISGTGGGFKRFEEGNLDICEASRPIQKDELEACRANNVDFISLKIGIDGISVVVNSQNTWCKSLTVDQLKRLWKPGSKIKTWDELDPTYPKQKIVLYGPDSDSGTFDYFTEAICGKRGSSRADYTANSNDNVLIQGVQGDPGAIGYFGYGYYVLNQGTLRALPISTGGLQAAPVAPTDDTISSGRYKPLSRPLVLYVNKNSLKRPCIASFLKFYLDRGPALIKEIHFIPLPAEDYAEAQSVLQKALERR
jgi:phosphate transport system substrate-binding protein